MDTTEKYLKLLELATIEQQNYIEGHQSRIKFYTSLISTIIAATFAGFLNSKEDYHFYALIIGPILVFFISWFGIKGTFRMYLGFLEAVTKIAKLEQELELTAKLENPTRQYWKSEPIVPQRHITSRQNSPTSAEFVNKWSNKGYYLWSKYLFRLFQIISVIMAMGLIFAARF